MRYPKLFTQSGFSFVLVFLLALGWGCSPYFHQPLTEERAILGPETPMKKDLLQLPEPKEPLVVAVYKFRDQTGQYKPSNTGASWSTAVTQGATNILIRALEESRWFVPIERENIGNLLNERKIIRSSREQYEGRTGLMLPPLLFAGVLLEGGIISYETNILTGGAGVRYFGADASAQYREDRVSIYLRAVSTSNGKILKTVYTTKSILSQEVSVGVFRYVKFKRLLEAETGYTYNEPTELAVTEAIEKAVYSLIIEGMLDRLWEPANPEAMKGPVVSAYLKERNETLDVDHIGRAFNVESRGKFSVDLAASAQSYHGDYSRSLMRPGANIGFDWKMNNSLSVGMNAGFHQLYIRGLMLSLSTDYYSQLNVSYLFNPLGKFSPYLSFGSGVYWAQLNDASLARKDVLPYLSYRGGIECMLSDRVAVLGEGFINHMLSDQYDGAIAGEYNDLIWGGKLGVRFYFGTKLKN